MGLVANKRPYNFAHAYQADCGDGILAQKFRALEYQEKAFPLGS